MLRDARHRRWTARANYAQIEENAEHLKIVQAFASENAELAAEAMSVHIQQSAQVLVQDLFGRNES